MPSRKRRSAPGASGGAASGAAVSGGLSDAKLAARTGRSARDWFDLLDAEAATRLSHDQIVALLVDVYEAPEWGAQAVAVRYQHDRGILLPGEQDDGTFLVAVSRSVHGAQNSLLDVAVEVLTAQTKQDPDEVHRLPERTTAAWRLPGGDLLSVVVTSSVDGRCAVRVEQSGIRLPELVAAIRRTLEKAVQRIASNAG